MMVDLVPLVWIAGAYLVFMVTSSLYDRATGRDLKAECCEHCGETRDAVEDQTKDLLPLMEDIRDSLHEANEREDA